MPRPRRRRGSEVRLNIATGQKTIFAPSRGRRPHGVAPRRPRREAPPAFRADCPFCPGNEALLPPIIAEAPAPGGAAWRTRVVFNKYSALTPDAPEATTTEGVARAARGRHEVIIETPRHDGDLATAAPEEVRAVIETYWRRVADLRAEPRYRSIFVFRNHGAGAGVSLPHPHSQLIATAMVPPEVRRREARARRFYDRHGRSVFAAMVEMERADGRRLIGENSRFLAFVPFAAEVPFEIWIVPKRQQADFGAVGPREKDGLAAMLKDCLARLRRRLDDPDYNYVIVTASRDNVGRPWFCWYLRICPLLTEPGGFELGSGMRINPSLPEEDAAFLLGEG